MFKINTESPAKLNLFLKVLSKRSDGYHNIDTSFQYIDLSDKMIFKKTEKDILIESKEKFLLNHNNTIFQSAQKLKEMFKVKSGVKIQIQKNIPIGAGLGGGSSNSATTLVALNKLWDLNLSKNRLIEIGKNIGADVPFFIFGKNALGKGLGEELKPVDSVKNNFLLIQPDIHNSTKKMFNLLEQWRENNKTISANKQNDFWDVYLNQNPFIGEFFKINSKDYDLNLSGSGSCMFIKFQDQKEIKNIVKKIPSNWRLFFCKPLQYSPICYI